MRTTFNSFIVWLTVLVRYSLTLTVMSNLLWLSWVPRKFLQEPNHRHWGTHLIRVLFWRNVSVPSNATLCLICTSLVGRADVRCDKEARNQLTVKTYISNSIGPISTFHSILDNNFFANALDPIGSHHFRLMEHLRSIARCTYHVDVVLLVYRYDIRMPRTDEQCWTSTELWFVHSRGVWYILCTARECTTHIFHSFLLLHTG